MEISIDELLKGKGTIIKDKEYLPTRAYVEPFLEKISKYTSDFTVQVKLPNQITTIKDVDDITYNRVLIQAKMPKDYSYDNHDQVYGFLYGLDTKKPIVKMYRGGLNMACLNLCVFNPAWLNVQLLEPNKPIIFNALDKLIDKKDEVNEWVDLLKGMSFSNDLETIERNTGKWIHNVLQQDYNNGLSKVKLSPSTVINSVKSLFMDEKSEYFVAPESDRVSMFDVYNSFTDLICNDKGKDLINKTEKVLLLKDILEI